MAKVADPVVIKFLTAIRQSRSSMRDTSERIYQRYVALLAQHAASPEAVDKASLDFEDAKIKLAQAEIDLLNAQSGNAPAAAAFAPSLASVVAQAATDQRHLVYVHGICKHIAGYSDPMWQALHDYETTAFGLGILGQTRLEVLWSDVITPDTPQAAMAFAPALAIQSSERQRVANEIREELRQRAARHAVTAAAHMPAAAAIEPATAAGFLSIPTIGCIDDFTYYLLNDSIRAQVIGRFTDCLRPLLQGQADIDIISHSWGTVVAYEGLRELAASGFAQHRVRNWFTVGAALSIGAVKLGLRPENRDGSRPANVRRWVNLNAVGDVIGGPLQGNPYAVDFDFTDLPAFGCQVFLGIVSPVCAHGSYFVRGNATVNRDIFTRFIDTPDGNPPALAAGQGGPAGGGNI